MSAALLLVLGAGLGFGTGLGSRCALDRGQDPLPSPTTGGGGIGLWDDSPPGRRDATREAIERGLAWLARDLESSATGNASLGDPRFNAPVGVTALSALAFMAGGTTPRRGPYRQVLCRELDYLLDRVTPEGEEDAGYVHASEDRQSRMHGHGLAVLAFTQAYSLSPSSPRGRRLEAAIRLGIRRIEAAQGGGGGWYYEPQPYELTEGSVTVCLLWALRGARNAGFVVDRGVIDRALAYVGRLQEEDGGFIYGPQEPRSSIALTAACLSTLHALGVYDGPQIDDGYAYLARGLTARELAHSADTPGGASPFPFYERWYLAQTYWQHRDERIFRRWASTEWPRILREQLADGSWPDIRSGPDDTRVENRFGSAYATAVNVLVLSVPEGLLPAYQR